jgi:hypothetical protein
MFGFCDERPEANPHNPISSGVFSPDPCCELCCDRMGQIAKTTVNQGVARFVIYDNTDCYSLFFFCSASALISSAIS